MSIVSKKDIEPEMEFKCVDCGDTTTGQDIIDGTYLYIVARGTVNPIGSTFRCECCQDDHDDQE
jgi:hypothetical protein